MRNYFILYQDDAPINYKHLLKLYAVAEYNKKNRLYDTISFNTLKELTNRINNKCGEGSISKTTLTNFINDRGSRKHEYKYFIYNKEQKTITLNIGFQNNRTDRKSSFVVLSQQEYDYLNQQTEELMIRYYLYIKYYCGKSRSGSSDFTTIQFLQASNKGEASGANYTKISAYNKSLSDANLIRIEHFRDNNGHLRNKYTLP